MADVPDPESPGPADLSDSSDGGFCDDLDDCGLDVDREPPSACRLTSGFDCADVGLSFWVCGCAGLGEPGWSCWPTIGSRAAR